MIRRGGLRGLLSFTIPSQNRSVSHTSLVCFHRQCPLELAVKMNPVVSQPGYGTGGVMNSDWQTGVFDCCDDLGICK